MDLEKFRKRLQEGAKGQFLEFLSKQDEGLGFVENIGARIWQMHTLLGLLQSGKLADPMGIMQDRQAQATRWGRFVDFVSAVTNSPASFAGMQAQGFLFTESEPTIVLPAGNSALRAQLFARPWQHNGSESYALANNLRDLRKYFRALDVAGVWFQPPESASWNTVDFVFHDYFSDIGPSLETLARRMKEWERRPVIERLFDDTSVFLGRDGDPKDEQRFDLSPFFANEVVALFEAYYDRAVEVFLSFRSQPQHFGVKILMDAGLVRVPSTPRGIFAAEPLAPRAQFQPTYRILEIAQELGNCLREQLTTNPERREIEVATAVIKYASDYHKLNVAEAFTPLIEREISDGLGSLPF